MNEEYIDEGMPLLTDNPTVQTSLILLNKIEELETNKKKIIAEMELLETELISLLTRNIQLCHRLAELGEEDTYILTNELQ